LLGHLDRARARFDRALAARPGHREAELGRVECQLEEGDATGALAAVEPWLDDAPDGWLLAAAACDDLGMLDDVGRFLARARERAKQGYVAPHRRERHIELHLALSAYLGTPLSGPGAIGRLGALLAGARGDTGRARPARVPRRRLVRFVRNLVAAGGAASLPVLLDPPAEALVPGIRDAVHVAAREVGLGIRDDWRSQRPPRASESPRTPGI